MKAVPAASEGVEIELSGVEYMDSSGVATLVEGFKIARENSKTFVLVAPSPSVTRVLELAGSIPCSRSNRRHDPPRRRRSGDGL